MRNKSNKVIAGTIKENKENFKISIENNSSSPKIIISILK